MEEIVAILEEIGLPYAYSHFAEGESPEPPFTIYAVKKSNNFFADGIVYWCSGYIDIELYTKIKDPEKEDAVEAVLNAHEIKWDKAETYIPEERLYEVLYEFEKEM